MRTEEFTWDEDINFLQGFIRDPSIQALLDVNDGVANSQAFEQPVGPSCEVTQEVGSVPMEREGGREGGRKEGGREREREREREERQTNFYSICLFFRYQILLVPRRIKVVKRLN